MRRIATTVLALLVGMSAAGLVAGHSGKTNGWTAAAWGLAAWVACIIAMTGVWWFMERPARRR